MIADIFSPIRLLVLGVILLAAIVCYQTLKFRALRQRDQGADKGSGSTPGGDISAVLSSPWPFATLVLVCGIAITVAAQMSGINFQQLIASNQLVGGIIAAILGFLLLERLREYSERLKDTNKRVDGFHDSLKQASGEIRKELQADFQKRIDQGLAKFQDYVNEHSWVKKVIDELIADRFPNLRVLTESAIERLTSNDFETGYQLMRHATGQSRDKQEPAKLYANPEDLEFSAFVAAFIIGDAELAVQLHVRYKDIFTFDPAFVCSHIRYLALSNDRDGAADWIEHVKAARVLVSRFERLGRFGRLFPKRMRERINIQRAMCQHWTAACVDVVDAVLHEPVEKTRQAKQRLLSLKIPFRDQIVRSYMVTQIELLAGSPENALAFMDETFRSRAPTALEFFLYIKISRDCVPVLETERLRQQLAKLLPRSPAERDVIRLAAAYLDSLKKKTILTAVAG